MILLEFYALWAGNSKGYYSEYDRSRFESRDVDDAKYMCRSCNNCYHSASRPETDEEDEFKNGIIYCKSRC